MIYPRKLDTVIGKYLSRKEIIAVKGPRQTGKTTLLQSLQKEYDGVKKNIFLSFEKRTDLEMFEKDIEYFKKLYVDPYEIVFLDEFQYAKEGGQRLKYLYDTTGKKFIITGSSSLELTTQLGKFLTGRFFSFYLFPLSFEEFLTWKHKDLTRIYQDLKNEPVRSEALVKLLQKAVEEYIKYGGYPRVILSSDEEEKQLVLSSIMEEFLVKDIKLLLNLEQGTIVTLAKLLALQIGNLISFNELSGSVKANFSKIKNNISLLENIYLLKLVKPYYINKRLEIVKNPKVYFYDCGMRNFLIQNFGDLSLRTDAGALVENFVFNRLKEKYPSHPVRFWRTKSGAEVDFITEKEDSIIPYKVKYSDDKSTTLGKGFISFITKFKPENAYIVTKNFWGKRMIGKTNIIFLPLFSL